MSLTHRLCKMRITFGSLVIAAGISGVLSFALLVAAIGSEYWYIIEMNPLNMSNFEDMSSHSGLWRINEGGKVYSFTADYSSYSESELHMLNMHSVIVAVLPLSLVLLVFGGICGLVSALARSPALLIGTASYFFVCSLLTLCGVSLYIIYSYQAETEALVGIEGLAHVSTSFGWSLDLAWLSYGLEVLTGMLLLIAAHITRQQQSRPTAA